MRNFIDRKIRPFRLRIFFDEKYVNTRVSNIDRAGREIDWWKFIVESHLTTLRTFFSIPPICQFFDNRRDKKKTKREYGACYDSDR